MEPEIEILGNSDDNYIAIYVNGHTYIIKIPLNKLTRKEFDDLNNNLTKCIESIFNLGVMYGEDKVSNSIKEILKI